MKRYFSVGLGIILGLAVSMSVAKAVSLPYTFTSTQPIRSAEVNANDQALRDGINNHAAERNGHTTRLQDVLLAGNTTGGTSINFANTEALNLVLEKLLSDPVPATAARLFYVGGLLKLDTGAAIKTMVDLNSTQTLTGKTLSGTANTITNVSGTNVVITPAGNLTSVTAQAAAEELQTSIDSTDSNLAAHVADVANPHTVTAAQIGADATITEINANGTGALNWARISKSGSNLSDLATRSHTSLTDKGTNTHAQIDTHIANTGNPHNVLPAHLGNTTAQWNADMIDSIAVDSSALADNKVLKYNAGTSQLEYADDVGSPAGGNANEILGKTADNLASEWKAITGTANRVTVTHGANSVTLSGPQDLHTLASPTFNTVTAALSGNATTATALASNPSDCAANQFATTIAANGNLTCSSIPNAATTAASANTPSAIVARDVNGNFVASNANLTSATISSGADSAPLAVRRLDTQTANIQEWQEQNGTALASISKDGNVTTPYLSTKNALVAGTTDAAEIVARRTVGQTANIQEWQTEGSVALASVSPSGVITAAGFSGPLTGNVTGNASGTAANVTGTVAIGNGGTGQVAKVPAFNSLAPTAAKGDIIVHNGTDNVAINVGSNDHVLTADSAQASGVKWATVPGGQSYVSKAFAQSPYTAAASEYIYYDATGGASTVNLPDAALNTSKIIVVRKTDSSFNTVTIDGESSDTIGGSATRLLHTIGETYTIVSDGTNWQVVDHKTDTPAISFTPTIAGWGSRGYAKSGVWKRSGTFAEIDVFTYATDDVVGGAAGLVLTLPNSWSIDTAQLAANNAKLRVGDCVQYDDNATPGDATGWARYTSSTEVACMKANSASYVPSTTQLATADGVTISVRVPISGWTAN